MKNLTKKVLLEDSQVEVLYTHNKVETRINNKLVVEDSCGDYIVSRWI